jgi:hypothetical protein
MVLAPDSPVRYCTASRNSSSISACFGFQDPRITKSDGRVIQAGPGQAGEEDLLETQENRPRLDKGTIIFPASCGTKPSGAKHPELLQNKAEYPGTSSQVALTALRCETQIAKLDLVYSRVDWQLRSNKQTVGAIITHATENNLLNSHQQLNSQPIPCDVIAISQGHVELPYRIQYSDWDNLLKYVRMEHIVKYHNYYNVLWVGWEDGVATQRGIGIISKAAWDALGAESVSFILG